MSKVTFTADAGFERYGIQPGQTITFDANIPTADDGVAFYLSQLAAVESRVYETKYPSIDFFDLVPRTSNAPEWADTIAYRSYDGVTMGKFITGSADDLPRVAMSATIHQVPIGYAGNEAEWSLDELRKTRHLNMPIDVTLLNFARRGALEHMQRVAYFGDEDRGMSGLFNNENVAVENGTVDWLAPSTSPMDIVAEVNRILTSVWTQSKGVHHANTLVLPASLYAFIANTPVSQQFPDKTIYNLIQEKNLYTQRTGRPLMIAGRFQLEKEELEKNGVEVTGAGRILAYEYDQENLFMEIPMPWRTAAPQPRGLKIVVPAEYKMSGVEWRYPLSARYLDLA